jgi:hypothetical protein
MFPEIKVSGHGPGGKLDIVALSDTQKGQSERTTTTKPTSIDINRII